MSETLAAALVAAQSEMPVVDKDSRNPHFGNDFASLDNIIAKTRPVLNKHGLAIIQFPAATELGQPSLRTILMHGESGEQVQADMPLFLSKQDMQGIGSAITYARRYAWAAALGISSDQDDDGHHASQAALDDQQQRTHNSSVPEQRTSYPPGTITEPQQKRLFAIAKSKNVDNATVARLVKEIAGVDSTAAVPKSKYEAVCNAVENGHAPAAVGVTNGAVDPDGDIPFAPTIDGLGG